MGDGADAKDDAQAKFPSKGGEVGTSSLASAPPPGPDKPPAGEALPMIPKQEQQSPPDQSPPPQSSPEADDSLPLVAKHEASPEGTPPAPKTQGSASPIPDPAPQAEQEAPAGSEPPVPDPRPSRIERIQKLQADTEAVERRQEAVDKNREDQAKRTKTREAAESQAQNPDPKPQSSKPVTTPRGSIVHSIPAQAVSAPKHATEAAPSKATLGVAKPAEAKAAVSERLAALPLPPPVPKGPEGDADVPKARAPLQAPAQPHDPQPRASAKPAGDHEAVSHRAPLRGPEARPASHGPPSKARRANTPSGTPGALDRNYEASERAIRQAEREREAKERADAEAKMKAGWASSGWKDRPVKYTQSRPDPNAPIHLPENIRTEHAPITYRGAEPLDPEGLEQFWENAAKLDRRLKDRQVDPKAAADDRRMPLLPPKLSGPPKPRAPAQADTHAKPHARGSPSAHYKPEPPKPRSEHARPQHDQGKSVGKGGKSGKRTYSSTDDADTDYWNQWAAGGGHSQRRYASGAVSGREQGGKGSGDKGSGRGGGPVGGGRGYKGGSDWKRGRH